MKRCIMFKNIDQQLTCQDCVHINPCSNVFIQTNLLFDHDQCSCLNFRHIITGLDQFIHCLVCETFLHFLTGIKRNNRRHDLLLPELLYDLAKFRLENDHNRRDQCSCQLGYDPEDRIHFKNICKYKKSANNQKTLEQSIRTGELDPYHKLIYKKCNQHNLYNINDIHRR